MNTSVANALGTPKPDKEALAAEIKRIEAELEKRRLEEEIRKMQEALEADQAKKKKVVKKKVVKVAPQATNKYAPNSVMNSLGTDIRNAALKKTPESKMQTVESVARPNQNAASKQPSAKPGRPANPLMSALGADIRNAALKRTPESKMQTVESVSNKAAAPMNQWSTKPAEEVNTQPPVMPPRSSLLAGISQAAAKREERLESNGGQHQMREHTPEVEAQRKGTPQLSFDMAELITKKAKDRDKRLAEGGEKKMTKIKEKEEYKIQFTDICAEAARMGRMTRLNEHAVEAVAGQKTPEQEWKSNGLLAINWRSNYMSVIQEAAMAGNRLKMPEKVVSNDPNENKDIDLEHLEKPMSPRMRQLLDLNQKVGEGGNKLDHFVYAKKDELKPADSMIVRPMKMYNNIEEVVLPRPAPPRYDPKKQKENLKKYAKYVDRPLQSIGNDVAARAWERRARLDRPGAFPKMKSSCDCPFCGTASPYQTFAYRVIEERRKQGLPVHIADPETEARLKREAQRAARRETRRKLRDMEEQTKNLEAQHVQTLQAKVAEAEEQLRQKMELKAEQNSAAAASEEEARKARREARRQARAAEKAKQEVPPQSPAKSVRSVKHQGATQATPLSPSPSVRSVKSTKSAVSTKPRVKGASLSSDASVRSMKSTKSTRSTKTARTASSTISKTSPQNKTSVPPTIVETKPSTPASSATKAAKRLPPQKATKGAACVIM